MITIIKSLFLKKLLDAVDVLERLLIHLLILVEILIKWDKLNALDKVHTVAGRHGGNFLAVSNYDDKNLVADVHYTNYAVGRVRHLSARVVVFLETLIDDAALLFDHEGLIAHEHTLLVLCAANDAEVIILLDERVEWFQLLKHLRLGLCRHLLVGQHAWLAKAERRC